MRLDVRLSQERDGSYRAWCPSLPGCSVVGESRQQVLIGIRGAVEGYLASLDVAPPGKRKREPSTPRAAAGV